MEPITLITAALQIATPYLIKSGEKFAEGIGEDIWKWIKKPFTSEEEKEIISDFQLERDSEKVKAILSQKLEEDPQFKNEFEKVVKDAENKMNSYNQQNIQNNGTIEKQVNIQTVNGDVSL
ncbi:hypothetical protein [Flavobacterium sp. 2]|uniref:hypothetical protein n=1 Tax=Flavobacterium sp. 2 TaxID=308053 RepID=UPI000C178260|nr:hypothetical protein [Flavobacterium sp. 2]